MSLPKKKNPHKKKNMEEILYTLDFFRFFEPKKGGGWFR